MQDIPLREGDRAWPLVAEAGRRLGEFADRPAFIGWGLRDFVFDRHFLAGFRDALPRARVMEFDDAGHYVLEDRHAVLVPAIREVLDANPVCGASRGRPARPLPAWLPRVTPGLLASTRKSPAGSRICPGPVSAQRPPPLSPLA